MKKMFLFLMTISLCVTTGIAQSSSKKPAALTDIRQVDFLNFTYHSSQCSQEYGRQGIGKIVRVRKGEFKNKNVYFSVIENKIIYADVTGDGMEDAILSIDCGAVGANFSRSEFYIYTIQNGRATLLAQLSDKDLERDYRRNYPDAESYWGISEEGLKVKNGKLDVEVLVDGPHAAPKYIVTLEYGWSGGALLLIGKPQRRSFSQ